MQSDRSLPAACLIIASAALCIVSIHPVDAVETGVRGALSGKGMVNTDEGANVIDSRLDFDVDVGPLTFGGAYRCYDFTDAIYNPVGIEPFDGLKHRYVEGRAHNIFLRAGHFMSTFGRGLTLRSFENVGLEYDTTLDGLIAEYEAGPVMMAGLTGVMTEVIHRVPSREHYVRGGRARAEVGDVLAVAVSGLDRLTKRLDERESLPDDLRSFSDNVLGAELEVWYGPFSLAGEYARREGDYYPRLKQDYESGRAAYISGSLTTARLTLLGEYKDYQRFANALVNPPTCVKEHQWTLMNRVTREVDLDNERGFLSQGSLAAGENLELTGGAWEARTEGGGLLHWEIFTQVEQPMPRWGIKAFAGSWSREYLYGKFIEYKSCGLDLEVASTTLDAVEMGIEIQSIKELSEETHENYLGSVTVYPWPSVTLAVLGESTTEKALEWRTWLFGEARVSVGGGVEVSLGAGKERGGRKCSGGVCYDEPEFTGVRLRFSGYF